MRGEHERVLTADTSTGSSNNGHTSFDETSHGQLLAVRGDSTAVKCRVRGAYERNRTRNMSMTGDATGPNPAASNRPGRTRPWWDGTDVFLAVGWYFLAAVGGVIVLTIFGGDASGTAPVYATFFSVLAFQILQGVFPWLISRLKGLGIDKDWRFAFSLPKDIGIGAVMAVGCFAGASLATVIMSRLVGLDDPNEASNTDILIDNQDSIWIIGVVALVVIGAPLTEELLFRGLILRAIEKSWGTIAGVILSTLLFTVPHWQAGATWRETVVLLTALGMVGLVLAIGTVLTDRLGPAIIAHFFFNGLSTVVALSS